MSVSAVNFLLDEENQHFICLNGQLFPSLFIIYLYLEMARTLEMLKSNTQFGEETISGLEGKSYGL